jgi:Reverse transcriptase (RNA-dependent DNA polymerase)
MQLLAKYGITMEPLATGEHVSYVERQVRTIKERVSAVRCSLSYQLDSVMLIFLTLYITDWLNLIPKFGKSVSGYTRHTRRKLNYQEVTRVGFGTCVVSPRRAMTGLTNWARNEPGVAVGMLTEVPGSIFFYSLETNEVKRRCRFNAVQDIDLTAKFGVNKFSAAFGVVTESSGIGGELSSADDLIETVSVQDDEDDTTCKRQSTISISDVNDVVPVDTPIGKDSLVEVESESTLVEDDYHVDLVSEPMAVEHERAEVTEPESHISVLPDIAYTEMNLGSKGLKSGGAKRKIVTIPLDKMTLRKRENRCISSIRVDFTHNHEIAIDVTIDTVNFARGIILYKDKALEAIYKEIKQIVCDYGVCVPSDLDYDKVIYMRAHDLLDEKMDGTIKARYVVGKQVGGDGDIDWGIDTFSPTIDMKVLYLMFSIALSANLDLEVWDVRGAFLKADMVRDGIYVKINPKIAEIMLKLRTDWLPFKKKDGSLLVEMKKAWYGTEVAPALWHKEIKDTLINDCGYTVHPIVPCLFYKNLCHNTQSYIMLHVDDIGAMMPPDQVERNRVHDILVKKYEEMKVQRGDKVTYIGLEITRDRVDNCFKIGMPNRIAKLCDKYNIVNCSKYPHNIDTILEPDVDTIERHVDIKEYRSIVMSVRYIAMTVKPELLCTASVLACRQNNPSVIDYANAIKMLEYLLGAKDECLILKGIGKDPIIRVYSDAAHRLHCDAKLSSHGGTAVFVGGSNCAIFCTSGKINVICKSSTDPELIELEAGTYLGDYVQQVLEGLGIKSTIVYMEDNDSANILSQSGGNISYDKKRRHIIGCMLSIRASLEETKATIEPILTKLQHADILTKPLIGILWYVHKHALQGTPNPKSVK